MSASGEEPVAVDPVFLGMTRPPMVWGVPYGSFVFNFLFTTAAFVIQGSLLMFLVAIPIHAVAYLLALKDPRIFDLILVRARARKACPNRSFWGAVSYSP